MRAVTKASLLKKAEYHEDKALEYYQKVYDIERKESLIGFKTKNDNRVRSDRHEIILGIRN